MKSKTFFILIFLSISAYAQVFNSGTLNKDYYTIFKYELVNEKIIIPVEIEGKSYRFILDTGAPTIISNNLSKQITTTQKDSLNITDANNIIQSLNLVSVPKLKIGGVIFNDTPALINKDDTNLIFDCFKVDGFIGSNLLRNSIIQILPQGQKIIITDDRKRLNLNRKNSTKIEFVDKQSTPYIWVQLKGKKKVKEQLFIDTGMSGVYDMANAHFEIFQENDNFGVKGFGTGIKGSGIFGAEKPDIYYQLTVPELILGNLKFKNITTETTNDRNSRIGAKILEYGSVTLDYIDKRFYFNPFQNDLDLQEKTYGFNPTIINGKLVVGTVWDETLKSQLKHGDQILNVNGIDFTNYNLCDLIIQKSIFKQAKKLEMTVIDGKGNEKLLTLFKR